MSGARPRRRMWLVGAAIGLIALVTLGIALYLPPRANPVSTASPQASAESSVSGNSTVTAPEVETCTDATPYSGLDSTENSQSTNGSLGILTMPAKSVGQICVTFFTTNSTHSTTIGLCSNCTGGMTVQTYSVRNGEPYTNASAHVVVLPNQTSVTIGGATHPMNKTVAFMVIADATAKGFYFLNVGYLGPVVCGVDFPFAVGYSFEQSNETGPYFALHGYRAGCYVGEGQVYSQVSGVVGIEVTQVDCNAVICDLSP